MHGVYVEELRLPPGAHVTLDRARRPGPGARASTPSFVHGDQVLVVASSAVRDAAEARLRAVARSGKLARWNGEVGS